MEITFKGISLESARRANEAMMRGEKPDTTTCGDTVYVHYKSPLYNGTISFSKSRLAKEMGKAFAKITSGKN